MSTKQLLINIKTQISTTFEQKHRLFGPINSPVALSSSNFNGLYWGGIALGLALAWFFATQQIVD